jgi:excinuclease ABC subunit C
MSASVDVQLKALPSSSGVYIFKDDNGTVLYVGKATNLSLRVRSYFASNQTLSPKVQKMVPNICNLEFITTDSEQEALILENTLIKKYRPRYNVRLKDDKTFPYLKIDLFNTWPSVRITRRITDDGSKYFGPFASPGSIRKTLRLMEKLFPFRHCNKVLKETKSKPCLNYHIHRCPAPCINNISKKDYDETIKQIILFLEGKQELILKKLKQKMAHSADKLEYENAAKLRDQIRAIENVIEAQKIAITVQGEHDVIALVQANDIAYIEILFIRNNKFIGKDNFVVEGIIDETPEQIMTSFIKQYYTSSTNIPSAILLQYPIEEPEIIRYWINILRGKTVTLHVPEKGRKKQLVNMAVDNAHKGLVLYQTKQPKRIESSIILLELKEKLHLPVIPARIEGYDISNIRGTSSVGSMIVFNKGVPQKSRYRRFRITTVSSIDDYAMIQEVLRRRFKNFLNNERKWMEKPDLVIIDGGKGHLNAAIQVLKELGVEDIRVASIAKENEEIFVPGSPDPVNFTQSSAGLHLLQRVRDEAHRFALSYHQNLRSRRSTKSVLDSITGIGPRRKKSLLLKFGSIKGIKEASVEELQNLKGINRTLAEHIKYSL